MGGGPPESLVMQLGNNSGRWLGLQARLRDAFQPTCVVYPGKNADIDSVVNAMRRGAIPVLPSNTDSDELSRTLHTAADCYELRRQWISESCDAVQRFNLLSARQREVTSRIIAGRTNKAIGIQPGINTKTVEKHRGQTRNKQQD